MYGKGIFEWLTLDMAIFVVLNIILIATYGDALSHLRDLTILEFLVLGLAAYRAANVLSTEVITKPLRSPFVDEVQAEDGKVVEKPKPAGFMGSIGLLIYCPSCTGVWIAAVFTYGFVFWPTATFTVALFFALSGMERIISTTLARLRGS
jgi:hypothetical protein